jgi:hypothetical protein
MGTNHSAVVTATKRNILYRILDNDTSQAAVATKAGIPTSTFHRKIHKPETFTIGELANIAAALGLQIEDIVKDAA